MVSFSTNKSNECEENYIQWAINLSVRTQPIVSFIRFSDSIRFFANCLHNNIVKRMQRTKKRYFTKQKYQDERQNKFESDRYAESVCDD